MSIDAKAAKIEVIRQGILHQVWGDDYSAAVRGLVARVQTTGSSAGPESRHRGALSAHGRAFALVVSECGA